MRPSPALKRADDDGAGTRANEAGAEHPRLTAREIDVIELAVLGLTNRQIAQRLSLSTYAIKFHLSSAYAKLGVANRTQAAVAFLELRREGRV
jgi:DNA-binding NarL/FixJ family response regulator